MGIEGVRTNRVQRRSRKRYGEIRRCSRTVGRELIASGNGRLENECSRYGHLGGLKRPDSYRAAVGEAHCDRVRRVHCPAFLFSAAVGSIFSKESLNHFIEANGTTTRKIGGFALTTSSGVIGGVA